MASHAGRSAGSGAPFGTGGSAGRAQRAATENAVNASQQLANLPPNVTQAQRFLAQRGLAGNQTGAPGGGSAPQLADKHGQAADSDAGHSNLAAPWSYRRCNAGVRPGYGPQSRRWRWTPRTPPAAVLPWNDRGGVWEAQNGASPILLWLFSLLLPTPWSFERLQRMPRSASGADGAAERNGSDLAGTGDPNDALDSYYGAGILRSTDGGTTWSVIHATADLRWSFSGEGFAGFAWGTANPQLVVAAVSQAYEGTPGECAPAQPELPGLVLLLRRWRHLESGHHHGRRRADVQGPNDPFVGVDGNAATSVVWNPARQLLWRRFATTAITSRRTASPGRG